MKPLLSLVDPLSVLPAVAAVVLSGCASFNMVAPKDGSVVRAPASPLVTTVTFDSWTTVQSVVVKLDGTT